MIVREAYRDKTLDLCRQHYNGGLPAPAGSPPLGPVLSAQSLLPCDWCRLERAASDPSVLGWDD